MNSPQGPPSPLYRRLLRIRRILIAVAFLLVLMHELVEYALLESLSWPQYLLSQALYYVATGPALAWLALTLLARQVRERDEAEAHLRSLNKISHQVIMATETKELVDIALRMLEQVVNPVGTTVILQEHPEGPWILAGTRGLRAGQREALEAYLMSAGAHLRCGRCTTLASTARWDCPLMSALPEDLEPAVASVICLPLSTERPPHALLHVYLSEEADLAHAERQVLESMTSGLAVAMDHARLRARELQMLQHMEQAVRQRDGLTATLAHILADVATAYEAELGAAFLASRKNGNSALIPIASWPGEQLHPRLVPPAHQALGEGNLTVIAGPGESGHTVALPLVAEGLTMGALVLAGRRSFTTAQATFLSMAAGMMALVVRNSQLYARLESQAILEERSRLAREVHDGIAQSLAFLNIKMQQVDRLLAREQWEAARQAVQELRARVQDIYTEVRLTIQGLHWPFEEDHGLAERLRQYVTSFADRTGLEVSLSLEGEPHLSASAEVQLFRIAQEALTNVHRHARAQRVWVRLRASPAAITLEVEDDGVGLPAEHREGGLTPEVAEQFGLRIVQERVETVGGQLSLHSVPGRGAKLQVMVPIPDVSIHLEKG